MLYSEVKQMLLAHLALRAYGPGMSASTRHANLSRILEERFEGRISALARAVDRDDAYLWQLLRGNRNVGERVARHLESKLGLGKGALDQPSMIGAETLAEDERELLDRYRRASPTWKIALRYLAALKGDVQDEVSQDVNVLLSKIAAEHVPDERVAAAYGRPGVHEPRATYKKKP